MRNGLYFLRFGRIKSSMARNYPIVLLLVVAGFALYAGTFQNQMFWDDNDGIINNLFIQDWRYFPQYFSENLIAGANLLSNYWRPMLLSVFSLEWHIWADWSAGYHFINASFHIADAVLLFFILLNLFRNRRLAILTSLVFLVHPLQTEAVTYVSGLGDSLSVFFIFSGLLFYLKFRASEVKKWVSGFYWLSILMYVFALMSKETAIIMPGLIFICDFLLLSRNAQLSVKEKLKTAFGSVWTFIAIAGAYILLRATVLNFINTFNLYNEETVFTSNLYIRIFTFFETLIVYFSLLFWPIGLHMERGVEIAAAVTSRVTLGGLIFFGLLATSFSRFKKFPILSFGILWFFIAIAPMSNITVPINGLLYEHWLYLPMVGIFLVLIWLGMRIAGMYNLQKIFLGIFILFLIFLSVLTINRNKEWRDPITLYNQTLLYSPDSYRVINNLGMAYADSGDYELAEKTYKKAIALEPSVQIAYHNLGNLYRDAGKTDEAIRNYKTAIKFSPKFSPSYSALIGLYLKNGNEKDAEKIYGDYIRAMQSEK